jgi:hypothetical protein
MDTTAGTTNTAHSSWQDSFGNAIALFEGVLAGPTVLVVAPSSLGMAALETLMAVAHSKGRWLLAVMPALHSTPMLALLKATEPRLVIEVGEIAGLALAGAASVGEAEQCCAASGLVYLEANSAPAWNAQSWSARFNQLMAGDGPPSLVLGAASSVNCAAMMVNLALLGEVLALTQ